MGPVVIGGLPAHVLLVHGVVVLVPLAALLLVAGALWPALRRRLGVGTPLLALAGLVCVPLATHAGEWLRARVPATPLVARHAELGNTLLPWAIGLFVVAAGQWVWWRGPRARSVRAASTPVVTVLIAVLAVVVAVGAVVQVYRIGESGSAAVWTGSV